MCPRCHTPVDTAYGHCPRGDFDGKMLPIEAPQPIGNGTPKETGAAPTPVTPPSPAIPQSTVTQQSRAVPDTRPRYACPRCGTKVDPASNECPNRGCGYIGPMQRVEMEQQPDESPPRAAGEGTIPPSRSPLLDEITTAEPKDLDVTPPRSPLLEEITEGEPTERRIARSAKAMLPKLVSATRKATRFSGQLIRPSPREKRLLLRGFWAAVFLAIAGFGIYYAVTQLGNVSLPWTSTANPIATPTPAPAPGQTYTLSTDRSPEGAGEVSLSPENETYQSGAEVTLTAEPLNGYTFDRWGGDAAGSSETIPVAMDSNKSVTAYFKPKDATPPEISGIDVSKRTDSAATITWTTDDPATSQIEYGTTRDYGQTAQSDENPTTTHKVRLTRLEPNTKYYFRVKSINESGIEAESHRDTLTTLGAIPVGYREGNYAPGFTDFPPGSFAFPTYQVDSPQSPGDPVALSKFLGKKVVLDFWSTRCSACLAQFPLIRGLYEDEKWADKNSEDSDYAVITVCIDGENTDRIETLSEKYSEKFGPFNFLILLDEGGTTTHSYHIWRIPYTVFIDSDGIIRETRIGRFQEREEIESILNHLE